MNSLYRTICRHRRFVDRKNEMLINAKFILSHGLKCDMHFLSHIISNSDIHINNLKTANILEL